MSEHYTTVNCPFKTAGTKCEGPLCALYSHDIHWCALNSIHEKRKMPLKNHEDDESSSSEGQ
jgi:hypothetical protein